MNHPPHSVFGEFFLEFRKHILDDSHIAELLLGACMIHGHVLLEGPPGVAKTSAVKVIAKLLGRGVKRVQFTPDLMPNDITGYLVPSKSTGANTDTYEFQFRPGPIFTSVFIADEINRAPARTQSSLLEAMEERNVTVEGTSHPLPDDFWVLATQNPREMEGTYPLPEAQLDRFALVIHVDYPSLESERSLGKLYLGGKIPIDFSELRTFSRFGELKQEFTARRKALVISEPLLEYALSLVRATRTAGALRIGASPRAVFHLLGMASALAIFDSRPAVDFDDIKSVARAVLSHRIQAHSGYALDSGKDVVAELLNKIPVPR